MQGLFISFEGGEGSGKSTQIARLKLWLEKTYPDQEFVMTREPGGTAQAEEIRAILVNGRADKITPQTEALLMIAARTENVDKVIKPALARNAVVVSDRFVDSSRVYQALAVGNDISSIDQIHEFGFGNLQPDLTFVMDVEPDIGLQRAYQRIADKGEGGSGDEDRFETKGPEFHQRVRAGFLALAEQFPARIKVIDASLSPDDVTSQITSHITSFLDSR